MNSDLFIDDMKISSFVKNSDKIWEGIIVTRTDGLKTVLNEETGRWRRLSDLDNIKILNENFLGQLNATENKNIKYNDLKSNFAKEIVGEDPHEAVENAESILTNKNALLAGGTALFNQSNAVLTDKAEAPKDKDTAQKDFNDIMKNTAAQKEAEKSGKETADPEAGMAKVRQLANIKLGETYKLLHPSLQPFLEHDGTEWDDLYDDEEQDLCELCSEPVGTCNCHNKDQKYENNDYLDVPDEVIVEILGKVKKYLENKEEDIENKIKKEYELSDGDAEEFVIQAMEMYLKNSDVKPRDSIKSITDEEVEKSFENIIDNYNGPLDEMLDYLADTYEIDPSEAEKIVEKTKGNLTETIFSFVDIVKKKLKETYDDEIFGSKEDQLRDLWSIGPLPKKEVKLLSAKEEIQRDYERLTRSEKNTFNSFEDEEEKLKYLDFTLGYRDYYSQIDGQLNKDYKRKLGLNSNDNKSVPENKKLGNDYISTNSNSNMDGEANKYRPLNLEDVTIGDIKNAIEKSKNTSRGFHFFKNNGDASKDLNGRKADLISLIKYYIQNYLDLSDINIYEEKINNYKTLYDHSTEVNPFIENEGKMPWDIIERRKFDMFQKPVKKNLNLAGEILYFYLKDLKERPKVEIIKKK